MSEVNTTFETHDVEVSGAVARKSNAVRVFVSPADFKQAAVTGTWALTEASNVLSLATSDAGSTNVFHIPFPAEFSDFAFRSNGVDRGVRVIGLEVIYQVATSALGAINCTVYKGAVSSVGVVSATAVPDTTTFDTDGDDGTEIDTHIMKVAIAANNRFFVASGQPTWARFEVTDGTSSDVNIFGAVWHLELTKE